MHIKKTPEPSPTSVLGTYDKWPRSMDAHPSRIGENMHNTARMLITVTTQALKMLDQIENRADILQKLGYFPICSHHIFEQDTIIT